MIRYRHLSKTEHIMSFTNHEVAYIRELLRRGPIRRTKKTEEIHDLLLDSCNKLLKPIEKNDEA